MNRKLLLLLAGAALSINIYAQEKDSREAEQIVITRKGSGDEKMNIVIDGDKVTVNGEPVNNEKDGPITVKRRKIKDVEVFSENLAGGPGNATIFKGMTLRPSMAPNKAMLGVTTNKTESGVEVIEVSEKSAAEKAGLQQGDIITKIDGKTIETPDDLSKLIRDKNPGDIVKVSYIRDGKNNTADAVLTKWQAKSFSYGSPTIRNWQGDARPNVDMDEIFKALPDMPEAPERQYRLNYDYNISSPKLGIKIQESDEEKGVKVLDVEEGSLAGKAGLRSGDIIISVDGTTTTNADMASRAINAGKRRGNLKLKINRNGNTQTIDVAIPKNRKTADL